MAELMWQDSTTVPLDGHEIPRQVVETNKAHHRLLLDLINRGGIDLRGLKPRRHRERSH